MTNFRFQRAEVGLGFQMANFRFQIPEAGLGNSEGEGRSVDFRCEISNFRFTGQIKRAPGGAPNLRFEICDLKFSASAHTFGNFTHFAPAFEDFTALSMKAMPAIPSSTVG